MLNIIQGPIVSALVHWFLGMSSVRNDNASAVIVLYILAHQMVISNNLLLLLNKASLEDTGRHRAEVRVCADSKHVLIDWFHVFLSVHICSLFSNLQRKRVSGTIEKVAQRYR